MQIEIFALSAQFNLTERREIFISLLFNIVLLRPGFLLFKVQIAEITRHGQNYYFRTVITLSREKLKVGLHYGDYRSKLVPFEEHKNIFYI